MVRFDFSKRDIVMMAAFLALMFLVGMIWLAGTVVGTLFHGILFGMVLIAAAVVIGKRYTILALGLVYTLIDFSSAHMYGGTLTALNTLAGAVVLELVLRSTPEYAMNLKLDVIGSTLYGFVSRVVYVAIMVLVYGLYLPLWTIAALIVPHIITFAIGGYLGYKLGGKAKNVLESV
ncbi:hypothetical protein [Methanobacterium ferruginis]|uniref:hypothetical protein n=1 Tax=Methanobacterium ferruginis TaxID=710191 RepID=UPI0025744420|nr:hypothetical protein [Methanobacterium ferruginis]BDZ68086.1 hypothetical protein GCM10025860_15340 [Methanobacterium ferruginis]